MGLEKQNKSAAYKRENDQVYGIGPIAAHFENCLQYFERLSASLETRPSEGTYIYSTVDGCLSEFRMWGNDTGAPEGLLDHALRKSSRLQKAAKDLLLDLYSTLHTSKTFIYLSLLKFLGPAPIHYLFIVHISLYMILNMLVVPTSPCLAGDTSRFLNLTRIISSLLEYEKLIHQSLLQCVTTLKLLRWSRQALGALGSIPGEIVTLTLFCLGDCRRILIQVLSNMQTI